MTSTTTPMNKRLATFIVLGVVLALAAALAFMASCTPAEPKSDTSNKTEEPSTSGLENQAVDWTMESDCSTCHLSEAESADDPQCAQALAHKDKASCIQCHTDESVLSEAHDGITYGDKPATKPTVLTVSEQTCVDCHGAMQEMAVVTAGSTALTDSNGTSVNPHDRPIGQTHDENPSTCTDCHNNHSQNLEKDAMKYCASCHHRGVFTCGNCHEVRTR